MSEKLLIQRELAQAILDYLKTRPYMEVAGLIAEIVKCPPAEPPAEATVENAETS